MIFYLHNVYIKIQLILCWLSFGIDEVAWVYLGIDKIKFLVTVSLKIIFVSNFSSSNSFNQFFLNKLKRDLNLVIVGGVWSI